MSNWTLFLEFKADESNLEFLFEIIKDESMPRDLWFLCYLALKDYGYGDDQILDELS